MRVCRYVYLHTAIGKYTLQWLKIKVKSRVMGYQNGNLGIDLLLYCTLLTLVSISMEVF